MTRVRFGAVLGTLDEDTLLEATLAHLRRIGVERIAVTDLGSTDRTLEILAREEARGDVWVVHVPAPDDDPSWEVIEGILARALDAEWVLFLDTDERWIPAAGRLDALQGLDDQDIVTVGRYNTVILPDGPALPDPPDPDRYDRLLLYALGVPDAHRVIPGSTSIPYVQAIVDPKVMVRPEAIASLANGDHDVVTTPRAWRRGYAQDCVIAHLPFTTLERFQRKVDDIRQTIAASPEYFTGFQGWQWTYWVRMADEGRIEEEFARQVIEPADIASLRDRGVIRSAAELLAPVVPDLPDEAAYTAALGRIEPWVPAVDAILRRERLRPQETWRVPAEPGQQPVILLPPDLAVKLFGPWGDGLATWAAEEAAYRLARADPLLPVPRLIGAGALDAEWRYLVTAMLPGRPLQDCRSEIDADGWLGVAGWLGRVLRQMWDVPVPEAQRDEGWTIFLGMLEWHRANAVAWYQARGTLPDRLLRTLDAWLPPAASLVAGLERPVLIHADLHDGNVLGWPEHGSFRATGLLDLGRSMIGHPLFEIGPLARWTFHGDAAWIAEWCRWAAPPGWGRPGFARTALAFMLLHRGDTLEGLAPVASAGDLDDLAWTLFGAAETAGLRMQPAS